MNNEDIRDLKKLFNIKLSLMEEKLALLKRIEKGVRFFKEEAISSDLESLKTASEIMKSIAEKELEIDNVLKDIDILIISANELLVKKLEIKLEVGEAFNGVGDIRAKKEMTLKLFNDDVNVISIDDIWTMILLKDLMKPTNISFIEKNK